MPSLRARTELLWENYFREPSLWFDHRKHKNNPRAPDFTARLTQESLWIDSWYTPSWVKRKLLSEDLQGRVREGETRKAINGEDEEGKLNTEDITLLSSENRMITRPLLDDLDFLSQKGNGGSENAERFHGFMENCGVKSPSISTNIFVPSLEDISNRHHMTQECLGQLKYLNKEYWCCIIRGYLKREMYEDAFVIYDRMKIMHEDVQLSARMYVAMLRACSKSKSLERGREMHAMIVASGMQVANPFIGSALIYLYCTIGSLAEAQHVFNEFFVQDVVMWTALITGYTRHGYYRKAVECFKQMQSKGVSPNIATFVSILKTCDCTCTLIEIEEILTMVETGGFLARESVLGSAFVNLYARSGLFDTAQQVFDSLPFRNIATWNALLSGLIEQGKSEEALRCFERMQYEGIPHNSISFTCGLQACSDLRAVNKGKEMHVEIDIGGYLETDVAVGNALVNMYSKCDMLELAKSAFTKLKIRDVIAWTALIAGFTKHGYDKEAVNCYEQMQLENVIPNAVTFICVTRACSSIGAIKKCIKIHSETERMGFSETHLSVGNALIDMYAKGGLISCAWQVFCKLPYHDIVSWNTLITGYARLGDVEKVFQMFHSMQLDGKNPDCVTFLAILNTCSRSCLYNRSQTYLELMSHSYGIAPTIKHYTCLVDLLGRAGELGKALEMIMLTPLFSNIVTWRAMLSGCRYWGNVELGKFAFKWTRKHNELTSLTSELVEETL